MAFTYYGVNAWLPDSYVERGWGDTAAGSLLAILNLVAIPAALIVPWLSDRLGTRRRWLLAMTVVFLVGMSGIVLAPAAAYVWAVALGLANGAMFALVLTLPLDLEDEPRRVGALIGMMLGLGYTLGAVSPFVLGAIRDASGSFTAPLWILTAFSALLVAAAAALPKSVRNTHR